MNKTEVTPFRQRIYISNPSDTRLSPRPILPPGETPWDALWRDLREEEEEKRILADDIEDSAD